MLCHPVNNNKNVATLHLPVESHNKSPAFPPLSVGRFYGWYDFSAQYGRHGGLCQGNRSRHW